ncbi:MAG: putative short chain dehydrogenase/reductase [Phycisphaerae bacterium]
MPATIPQPDPASPERPLNGQVAIISGGLGDIGRAIALELARQGAEVAVGDLLEPAQAEPLLEQVRATGRRARYDRVDVADWTAVESWVSAVEGELGAVTCVIPNAAIVHFAPLPQLTADQWRRELAVNLDGAFHLAQAAALRLLALKRPGRIVFVGSWAGHAVHTGIPTYCVSKAGLRMLCRCMAAELSPHGILVNEIAPGYVDAGLTGRYYRSHPGAAERDRQSVPVRLLIEPEEVAVQVAWLCHPTNRHMAGATIVMDGGLSLYGAGGRRD